jgi:hypothetical protein
MAVPKISARIANIATYARIHECAQSRQPSRIPAESREQEAHGHGLASADGFAAQHDAADQDGTDEIECERPDGGNEAEDKY